MMFATAVLVLIVIAIVRGVNGLGRRSARVARETPVESDAVVGFVIGQQIANHRHHDSGGYHRH